MLYDLRTYTARPGQVGAFLKLYEEHCWAVQVEHLQRCIGIYTVTDGPLNQIVLLWEFDSYADRETKRRSMIADLRWKRYMEIAESSALLAEQRSCLMTKVGFCLPFVAPMSDSWRRAHGSRE